MEQIRLGKYRKVPREKNPVKEDEIRITSSGRLPNYLVYALKVLQAEEQSSLTIKATGNAIAKAVTLAELVKRRIVGVHQVTKCGSTTITDEYEPVEQGLDKVKQNRTVSFIEIIIGKKESDVDKNDPGYQPPIDEALVKPANEEELTRAVRGRRFRSGGGYRGGGRSGGRGGYRMGGSRGRGGRGGYGRFGDDGDGYQYSRVRGGGYGRRGRSGSRRGSGRGGFSRGRGRGGPGRTRAFHI